MQNYALNYLGTEYSTGSHSMSQMLGPFEAIGQGFTHHRVALAYLEIAVLEIQRLSLLLPLTTWYYPTQLLFTSIGPNIRFIVNYYSKLHFQFCYTRLIKYRLFESNIQTTQGGNIGIVMNTIWFEPFSNSLEDKLAVERAQSFYMNWCSSSNTSPSVPYTSTHTHTHT